MRMEIRRTPRRVRTSLWLLTSSTILSYHASSDMSSASLKTRRAMFNTLGGWLLAPYRCWYSTGSKRGSVPATLSKPRLRASRLGKEAIAPVRRGCLCCALIMYVRSLTDACLRGGSLKDSVSNCTDTNSSDDSLSSEARRRGRGGGLAEIEPPCEYIRCFTIVHAIPFLVVKGEQSVRLVRTSDIDLESSYTPVYRQHTIWTCIRVHPP